MSSNQPGLYLCLISVHGLLRGDDLELGRDADTGGQTKYVVELARALAERDDVARCDLFTRRIVDDTVSSDYAVPIEELGNGARIVRIECGPQGYMRKEELWPHLDAFSDNMIDFVRQVGVMPDAVHSHYADAGYVGVRVASFLGRPLVHTGHSLGRVKRRRLLASGLSDELIEKRYHILGRIQAEEETLACAELVITSTQQEIEEQYGFYDHYSPEAMHVVPPGTDLSRFRPPDGDEWGSPIGRELQRFLHRHDKPMVLALSRPDERKNIATLIEAYGENQELQDAANLVIVAGNREDIRELDDGAQSVLTEILLLIDRYDLYGKVAYPRQHRPDDVPILYRLASISGGVFVNPALTEPFGLTLIEAAASGVPIVATEDGGPNDILANCENGLLIDPLDSKAMAEAILAVIQDSGTWRDYSVSGLRGVNQHYSWQAHAEKYLGHLRPLLERQVRQRVAISRGDLLYNDRAVFTDLDQNLVGDPEGLERFVQAMREHRKYVAFGIATGRKLKGALQLLRQLKVPRPDVLITSLGTKIHYAPRLVVDTAWREHIDHLWNPRAIHRVLGDVPGMLLQEKDQQSRFKISYYIDPQKAPPLDEIEKMLHQEEQSVHVMLSFGQFLDIVPVRASKGMAIRYVATKWGIPLENMLVAGGLGRRRGHDARQHAGRGRRQPAR
jgi:sucrose-phosphate synthase